MHVILVNSDIFTLTYNVNCKHDINSVLDFLGIIDNSCDLALFLWPSTIVKMPFYFVIIMIIIITTILLILLSCCCFLLFGLRMENMESICP